MASQELALLICQFGNCTENFFKNHIILDNRSLRK